jgi:hypothetical protein
MMSTIAHPPAILKAVTPISPPTSVDNGYDGDRRAHDDDDLFKGQILFHGNASK